MAGDIQTLVTVFRANSVQFQAAIAKMSASVKRLSVTTAAAGKAIATSFQRIGIVAGGATVLAIKHFAEYEKRMVAVKAVTGATGKEYEMLQKKAKEMGATTIFTSEEAAEAMQVMAMAGLTTTEIMTAMGPAMELAAAGEVSVAEAADIAAKTMRGMGLTAQDLTTVNNVLVGALTTSNTNMTQLGEALKYVAPLSASTGTSIEDTVAAIGKLSDAGFQGSMAGTGLRMMMARLGGAIPEVTNKLNAMGIQTLDASGNMLPLFDIVSSLESKGLSAGQVMELFGARAGPQVLALLNVGGKALKDYSADLHQADLDGVAARITQEKLNSVWGQWKLMVSAVSGVVIDAVDSMIDSVRGLQASFLAFFDDQQKRQATVAALATLFRKTIDVVRNLTTWLRENAGAIGQVFSMWGKVVGVVADFLAQHPQLLAALIAWKSAQLLGVVPAILKTVQALGVLIFQIGTTAVAAMGRFVAFVVGNMITSLGALSAGFTQTGAAAAAAWTAATLGISLLITALISLGAWLATNREKVWSWVKSVTGNLIPTLQSMGGKVLDWLKSRWDGLVKFFSGKVSPMVEMLAETWEKDLWPALVSVWKVVEKELLPAFGRLAGGVGGELMDTLAELGKTILLGLVLGLKQLAFFAQFVVAPALSYLASFLDSAVTPAIVGLLKLALLPVKATLMAINGVLKAMIWLWDKITGLVTLGIPDNKLTEQQEKRLREIKDQTAAIEEQTDAQKKNNKSKADSPDAKQGPLSLKADKQVVTFSPGGGASAAAGGGGGGGGGGASGGGILDRRQQEQREAELEKQHGRKAATESTEFGDFMATNPSRRMIDDYLDTVEGITDADRVALRDRHDAQNQANDKALEQDLAHANKKISEEHTRMTKHLEGWRRMGVSEEDIQAQRARNTIELEKQKAQWEKEVQERDAARRQANADQTDADFLTRRSAHHERERQQQQQADMIAEQQQVGSLSRRLEAQRTHGDAVNSWATQQTQQQFDELKQQYAAGNMTQEQYKQSLARLNQGFQSGTQFAHQFANAEMQVAHASVGVRKHVMGVKQRFLQLQKQFQYGQITQAQYNMGLKTLTASMREGTDAAKKEAEQKRNAIRQQQRMMKPRGGGGGGGGGGGKSGGKAHPMDFLLARLSMAQAKAQLLMPNKQAFGRTIAGHRTGDIRKRRQSFGQAMADVQHIQRLIGNMRMSMMRGPMMQARGMATLDDPGMVTQQQGAVTISLPNVTRMNNEEIASVSDRLDEYRSRQGRQVV